MGAVDSAWPATIDRRAAQPATAVVAVSIASGFAVLLCRLLKAQARAAPASPHHPPRLLAKLELRTRDDGESGAAADDEGRGAAPASPPACPTQNECTSAPAEYAPTLPRLSFDGGQAQDDDPDSTNLASSPISLASQRCTQSVRRSSVGDHCLNPQGSQPAEASTARHHKSLDALYRNASVRRTSKAAGGGLLLGEVRPGARRRQLRSGSGTMERRSDSESQMPNSNEATLEGSLVVVMVGLPARGKSYIIRKLMQYLQWNGSTAKVFNVGNYRREVGLAGANADFFGNTEENVKERERMAVAVQDHMYAWMKAQNKSCIGMFDATNSTRKRREMLIQRCKQEPGVGMLFIESICTDQTILQHNYSMKLQNEDYRDRDRKDALKDFMERVRMYELVYETMTDDEDGGQVSYIKLYNVGQKVCSYNCHGYLPSQISFYLQNMHIRRTGAWPCSPRKIWLTHHAESVDLVKGKMGGNQGELTPCGKMFTLDLADFLAERAGALEAEDTLVISGTHQVHAETLKHMDDLPCLRTALVNELRGGDLDGMTSQEIMEMYPNLYSERMADKFNFRYPGAGGESYFDVMQRVRPIIIELERQRRPVVVVRATAYQTEKETAPKPRNGEFVAAQRTMRLTSSLILKTGWTRGFKISEFDELVRIKVCHLAVLRCLFAYFTGVQSVEEIPYLDVKLHTVYELTPGASGCSVTEHVLSTVSEDYVRHRKHKRRTQGGIAAPNDQEFAATARPRGPSVYRQLSMDAVPKQPKQPSARVHYGGTLQVPPAPMRPTTASNSCPSPGSTSLSQVATREVVEEFDSDGKLNPLVEYGNSAKCLELNAKWLSESV